MVKNANPPGGGGASVQTRGSSVEPITLSVLNQEFEKFKLDLTASLTESISKSVLLSVNLSISNLKDSIDTKVSQLQEDLKSISFRFDEFVQHSSDTISKLNKKISDLETGALFTTIHQNEKEQRYIRGNSFRVHGKKFTATTSKGTMKEGYDLLIQPCFSRAVDAGELEKIPDLDSCLAFAHPLKPRKTGDIPSVLFKFQNRSFHETFMKYVRTYVDELNAELGPGDMKMRVGPDLTVMNRRLMSNLYTKPEVDRVRLGSRCVQFTLKSNKTKWLSVLNPTADHIADLQIRVSNPLLAEDEED